MCENDNCLDTRLTPIATGAPGIQGPAGPQGEPGATGPQGPAGASASTTVFYDSVPAGGQQILQGNQAEIYSCILPGTTGQYIIHFYVNVLGFTAVEPAPEIVGRVFITNQTGGIQYTETFRTVHILSTDNHRTTNNGFVVANFNTNDEITIRAEVTIGNIEIAGTNIFIQKLS